MKFLILLSLIGLAASTAHYELLEEWNLWKEQHGKGYGSVREDLERHMVWLSNKKYIDAHNANSHIFGFTLAMNHFGDLTDDEFAKSVLTFTQEKYKPIAEHYADSSVSLPDTLDWRTKGAVTGIKNQDQCAASYAFSAIGALEGASALATGTLNSLSEQNIVDCSVSYGNHACKGGNMYNAFIYILANDGIDKSSGYPFQGRQTSCSYNKAYRGASISGIVSIPKGSEDSLLSAVASTGPVSVAIDGRSNAFRFYQSGVYDSSTCSATNLNHAMLVTGYGTYSSKDYWLVKNSWGTNWGMSGYVMMSRNKYNQCGIASDASYPTL